MSLRTKLLAAFLGLNGAILLLALYLLVRSEQDAPPAPTAVLTASLVRLGVALAPCSDEGDRRRALDILREVEVRGRVEALYVVEAHDDDVSIWPVAGYLDRGPEAREEAEGERRTRAEAGFWGAMQRELHQWVGPDFVAVAWPAPLQGRGPRGLVVFSTAPTRPRSGIRLVYLVMVAGAILLTAVAYALLSHLVVRPLDRITEAADRIATGDYRIQLETSGTNDEFDRTISAFNRMAREIGEYQGHLEDRVLSALDRMRKAEQHLGIAQRLAATGKLASGVAHEINNPLGGMKNAARALARGDLDEEKTREYLALITEGLARVEETVKKFLSLTPRRVEPRPTDLAVVATKALALARHRIKVSGAEVVESLGEPGEAVVFGDPHELMQVVLNFLLNAADAVKDVGKGARITLGVERRRDEAVLWVSDNGVGLSAEDQDRCFDLFFTTKPVGEGTGLGLAVAHTIVTNHGGRIELESRSGGGATFRILLPVEEAEGETTPPRQA